MVGLPISLLGMAPAAQVAYYTTWDGGPLYVGRKRLREPHPRAAYGRFGRPAVEVLKGRLVLHTYLPMSIGHLPIYLCQ